ncbi:DNA-directed RNA polymerase subunit delta [Cohnella sp. JJ-181]|uniref:DNA-directed RNA polymerase subunit delta n=1 Tax=Cohnella rhizoplanae TaxID=2974897 RepID=UPI0022FF5598|nr:DNA-directed RNA polymerase subunit delta [Cohnella sp. JJ-181]CAI6087498.1 DNA-directed RNA polymerase subunit delta [Cohnella sp. JJ-181]
MSAEYVLKFDAEKIREMPMVDLAFQVLKAVNTPLYYRDLMMEIAKQRGFSPEQINEFIAQVYTEINIDGRFACVGGNVWGLKRWYPVDRSDDPVTGGAKRPRIINDDDDLDDEDLYGEDEEETFTEPGEGGFDLFDEDREEIFEEGEEAGEADEEVAIDEESEEEEGIEGEVDEEDGFDEDEDEEEADDEEEDEAER